MKVPVVTKEEYILYLENVDGNVFIHCDCFKWNKGIKKKLKEDVDFVCKYINKPILAIHNNEDKKHFKFLNIMGFTFFNTIECKDKAIRELFIRRL